VISQYLGNLQFSVLILITSLPIFWDLWLFVSKLQLILNGNLDTAFPASMTVFSAHCSSVSCIQRAAQWKSGHSLSSFYSSLCHCHHFLATMPESWANHIKLLDLMENALIGEFPSTLHFFNDLGVLSCAVGFVPLNCLHGF